MQATLARRLVAEGLGTAILLAAVVGSGIIAERLAGGNVAIALLCNTLATGAILTVLILTFGPISSAPTEGAARCSGEKPRAETLRYARACHGHR